MTAEHRFVILHHITLRVTWSGLKYKIAKPLIQRVHNYWSWKPESNDRWEKVLHAHTY